MRKPASWIFFIISRQMTPLVFSRSTAVEDRAPHQPEVAVDVAHLQAEHQADDVVVEPADDDAVQRIRAADLVAVDEVGVGRERAHSSDELARIVLRVAVGVEDQVLGRRPEAGLQRAAVAAVLRVVNDADVRIGARQLVGDLRRRVAAAVVDDDDLVVGRQFATRPARRESPCSRWCRCRCRPGKRRSDPRALRRQGLTCRKSVNHSMKEARQRVS